MKNLINQLKPSKRVATDYKLDKVLGYDRTLHYEQGNLFNVWKTN